SRAVHVDGTASRGEVSLPIARVVDVRFEDIDGDAGAEAIGREELPERRVDVVPHLLARGAVASSEDQRDAVFHVVAAAGDRDGHRTDERIGKIVDLTD